MSSNIENTQIPECIICQDIFYQPVTLSCGHSYCRPCIKEGLKNKPLCPTCRNPVIGNANNLAINFTLQNIIETFHKEQYEQKKISIEQKTALQQAQNQIQGSRIMGNGGNQQQEQKLENVLLLEQNKMKHLFPSTTVNVALKYLGGFDKLLPQCSDGRVIIQFGQKDNLLAAYCKILRINNLDQNNNIPKNQVIKCEVKVISKVNIIDTQDVIVDYSEALNLQQSQPQEQIQQNNQDNNQQQDNSNNNQQNQRLFENGFTFKVANANIVEDLTTPADQVGIEEHTDIILQMIDQIIKNNGGINMTTFQLQDFLQKQNFLPFLQNGYINSISKANEFCWIICGIFNFTLKERERLWDTESVIERLALIKQYLKKFENINNVTSIFDIEAPGHSENLTLIIFGVIAALILFKFLSSYLNKDSRNSALPNYNNY